jgi:hypothetical protein
VCSVLSDACGVILVCVCFSGGGQLLFNLCRLLVCVSGGGQLLFNLFNLHLVLAGVLFNPCISASSVMVSCCSTRTDLCRLVVVQPLQIGDG